MSNLNPGDLPRHPGVYVLRYQSGYFYVGKTENVQKRVGEHIQAATRRNYGKIYKVDYDNSLLTPERSDLNCWEEDETIERMLEHGIGRVRGWEFTDRQHTIESLQTIKQLIIGKNDCCRTCGFRGHYGNECNTPEDIKSTWLQEYEKLVQGAEHGVDSHQTTANGIPPIDHEELVRNMANMAIPPTTPAPINRRGSRWYPREENQLRQEIQQNMALTEIARIHGRTVGAIEARLELLGAGARL